ncbi:MAG: PaaI family thioesterase [Chloroflexi bacterium]|nr:MAG: PaaI family thioesterase [Chloroflexota bacterium]
MNPQYNSASCFACGLENPSGLRLRFCDNGKDQVFTRFTLDLAHAGYPGMAHGGIVTAVLDEVGGRTMMINHPDRFFVTAHMDVHFRQPVPVGVYLDASGWLLKSSGRRTRAHAEIFTSEAGILAEANILFTDMPANLLNPDEARHIFGWRLYD